jgi:putative glutamine amidotransferase
MIMHEDPVIGITTRRMDADTRHLDVVDRAYSDAIWKTGGIPRLLTRPTDPARGVTLTGIDGLLLTGGGDVDPGQYGQLRSTETGGVDTGRDEWEIALVRQALELAMPVLGVCRGCQVLNVAFAGTLTQHLPSRSLLPHLVLERESLAHAVEIAPSTQLFTLEGKIQIATNSVHHQAIDTIGEGLRATAWAEDGSIEAIEHLSRPMIGVQWHPENLLEHASHVAVFEWLVEKARRWGTSHEAGSTSSTVKPYV